MPSRPSRHRSGRVASNLLAVAVIIFITLNGQRRLQQQDAAKLTLELRAVSTAPKLQGFADIPFFAQSDVGASSWLQVNRTLMQESYSFLKSRNCSPTDQISIEAATEDYWILKTYSAGSLKSVGGDEFYVSYQDDSMMTDDGLQHFTAVARCRDRMDGTYELRFVGSAINTLPEQLTGEGNLTVFLQYTCQMGQVGPPNKRTWAGSGALDTRFQFGSFPIQKIQPFQRPSNIHLSNYSAVFFEGDSITIGLLGQPGPKCAKAKAGFDTVPSNAFCHKNLKSPLNTITSTHIFSDIRRAINTKLRSMAGGVGGGGDNNQTFAIILGSAAWDLIRGGENYDAASGKDLDDHIEACSRLIRNLKNAFPEADFFWRSPTAFHMHEVVATQRRLFSSSQNEPIDTNAAALTEPEVVRYMSTSRAERLYDAQKELIANTDGVEFLDLYEASYVSADHPKETGDGRHWSLHWNEQILHMLYQ